MIDSSSDGFNVLPNSKYYDLYSYRLSGSGVNERKIILGDSLWESTQWYQDSSYMVHEDSLWSFRGGYYVNSEFAGIFSSGNNPGTAEYYISFRVTLIP